MRKVIFIFFMIVICVEGAWAEKQPRMSDEELKRIMLTFLMLEEGGHRFVLKDGIVFADVYEWDGYRSRLTESVELAEPEVVKAFLRKTIEKGLTDPSSWQTGFFGDAISALGNGALKDPTAQPLLKRMVFDSTLPWDIRSTAMETLAAIDFEGNLEMFFEVVEIYGRTTAYRIIARYGTPAVLDRLEKGLDKVQYEDFKAMVRELIADRRAELAGDKKKK